MTDLSPSLQRLGDALHAATTIDARRTGTPVGTRRRRRAATPVGTCRRRRTVIALVTAVVAIPGGALAASALLSPSQVAQSIPLGTLALLNTQPTCTTLTAGVEYDCTLHAVPSTEGAPLPGQWLGTVEATVDATKHVNGGCRSLNGAGTHWHCYIGQAAVREKIISAGFLGQPSLGPGVG